VSDIRGSGIVNDELKGIWKDSVVAYFKAGPLFQHLSERTEGDIRPYYNGPFETLTGMK
jgi:hypothetical protein